MSVSWVGGSNAVFSTAQTVAGTTPAGITDGDTILAAVFGRGTLETLSGWTKLDETAIFDGSSTLFTQRLAIFSKTTVTSSDASTSFTFTQSGAPVDSEVQRMGLVYAVFRDVDSIVATSDTAASNTNTWQTTPATLTAAQNGEMLAAFASSVHAFSSAVTPTVPASFTLSSGSSLTNYRVAAAYRSINTGDGNSGAFDFAPGEANPVSLGIGTNGLGAITVQMAPASEPPVEGYAAAPGPLGEVLALAEQQVRGLMNVASPLGVGSVHAFHDFTVQLDDTAPMCYVMDLVTPGGLVRVPVSSWQATLQTDVQSYVQCVIPAATDWVPDIEAATEFVITRRGTLLDGSSIEYEMARAPAQTVSLDGGAFNYTATISGYTAALDAVEDPPTALDRTLAGVRTVSRNSGNVRVRCNIDWLLRPGQRAYLNEEAIVVRYVNYYVPGFDQYMDIGDRAA